MSFGRFRLLSALSASAFCFWKRAECRPSDQSTNQDTPIKPTYDDYFMATAFVASLGSKDLKRKVGACIVTEYPHRLVGLGYNGMPDGIGFRDYETKDCWESDEKRKFVCHAEMNAIISAFRQQADLSSCTLYTTLSPCAECSKLIAQSGIKNVVYAQKYRECDDMRKLLAPLPALRVKHYEYLGDKAYGKIIIDLGKMKAFQQVSVESDVEKGKTETEYAFSLDDYLPMDDYFMALATLATLQSKSNNPVGACLVTADPYRAISIGSHGLPEQTSAEQEEDQYMCHAESNAVISAFRHRADLTSSILYTTSPLCFDCAKIIVQSGVRAIIYSPMKNSGTSKDLERAVAVEEIFYRARIPYLKYRSHTKKKVIIVDLKNHTVEQKECNFENEN